MTKVNERYAEPEVKQDSDILNNLELVNKENIN